MVIEWLTFRVEPEWHDRYLQADAAIWTQFLKTCPGYLGKQVWQDPEISDQIIMVIHWRSREQWKSIDAAKLEAVDRRFEARLGRTVEIIASKEYLVVSDESALKAV